MTRLETVAAFILAVFLMLVAVPVILPLAGVKPHRWRSVGRQ